MELYSKFYDDKERTKMNFIQKVYLFCNQHITWDFGPELNAKFSRLWRELGALIWF